MARYEMCSGELNVENVGREEVLESCAALHFFNAD